MGTDSLPAASKASSLAAPPPWPNRRKFACEGRSRQHRARFPRTFSGLAITMAAPGEWSFADRGSPSMRVSLAQAAGTVGRSRSTILRTIRAGKLSAERDELTGAWLIDMAELARVFPASAG